MLEFQLAKSLLYIEQTTTALIKVYKSVLASLRNLAGSYVSG